MMPSPTCPLCGKRMRRRCGPHGQFYGCEKYPGCRGTRQMGDEPEPEDETESLNDQNARLDKELDWNA